MPALQHLIDIRHDLHAHPELGYEEHRTSRVVEGFLKQHGVQTFPGMAKGTGLLGFLPATVPGPTKTVALRADMDALPIIEQTDLPYASKEQGKMHACGHDGHTTILLGTAERLAQMERPNNVVFVFQPAEEGGAGGHAMCQDGALDGSRTGHKVDKIFGLHGSPDVSVGSVGTRIGAMMASVDNFIIKVVGAGGHAAMPHTGVDPILVGSHIVTSLQSIVSRNVGPLDSGVVTVGIFQAGSKNNIIPDFAILEGTVRALTAETRQLQMANVERISQSVASALGAKVEISWHDGYPVTVNHADAVSVFRSTLAKEGSVKVLEEEVDPVMGGEDFSFYGHHVPACFFWLGLVASGQTSMPNLHSPRFDFNDAAIPVGISAMCALAVSNCV